MSTRLGCQGERSVVCLRGSAVKVREVCCVPILSIFIFYLFSKFVQLIVQDK